MTKRRFNRVDSLTTFAFGGLGLLTALAWIVKAQSNELGRAQSRAVDARRSNGLGHPPLSKDARETQSLAEDEYLRQRRLETRKFWEASLTMFILSVFVLLFIVISNSLVKGTVFDFTDKTLWDVGISAADATVIVIGLLTVVAALGIALAVSPSNLHAHDVRADARAAAWAYTTALINKYAATVALGVGLTQLMTFITKGKPGFGLVLSLTLMGAIAVMLSASIATWTGREKYFLLQHSHNSVLVRAKADEFFASLRQSPELHVRRSYIKFILFFSVGTAAAQVGLGAVTSLRQGYQIHWMSLTALLVGMTCWSALRVWLLAFLTIRSWAGDFLPQLSDRWTWRILRGCVLSALLLFDASLLLSWPAGTDAVFGVGFPLIEAVGSAMLPLVFLFLARRKRWGPAAFAVHCQRAVTYRQLEEEQRWVENL